MLDLTGEEGCPSLQLCLCVFYNELIIDPGNNFPDACQKQEEYNRKKKKTDNATASGCYTSLLVIVLIERSHVIQTAFFFLVAFVDKIPVSGDFSGFIWNSAFLQMNNF